MKCRIRRKSVYNKSKKIIESFLNKYEFNDKEIDKLYSLVNSSNMENTMTIKEYYDEIVKLTEEYLEQYEFKRSGTTSVFYRYNDNKTKGWIIGFRKSLDNTSD